MRALRHRDLSTHRLRAWLEERGFSPEACDAALESLERTGLVDDRRFAENRARTLAGRGAGDALIRHDLEAARLGRDLVDEALEGLEPEADRARAVVRRRGAGLRTARYLRSKGFSEDVVAGVVATARQDALG